MSMGSPLDVYPQQAPDDASAIPLTDPLFILIMVLAVLVSLFVAALVIYAMFRFRARPGQAEPPAMFGHHKLELTWTIIPLVVVLVLFILTVLHMRSASARPGNKAIDLPDRQPDIVAIGNQWWWEFRYPASGVVTANEIHLPVGRQVLVQLEASDVIHDFWIPQLEHKMDMVPGQVNYLWLEADRPGTFQGACAEYCGNQHAWMRILAIAQPEPEFNAWIQQQRSPVPPSANSLVEQGRQLFVQRTCGNCHAVASTSEGQAGPELTHFASRQTIGAGVVENTPENIAAFVRNPQAVKPGILMPNFRLSEEEVRALTAYLESLK